MFRDRLDSWIDNRIGNALILGVALAEIAAELTSRGITVTVQEKDIQAYKKLHAYVTENGDGKLVSLEPREYGAVNFESSSFNLILAWDGLPPGISVQDFFKKAKRELKAGSMLYLRTEFKNKPIGKHGKFLGRLPYSTRLSQAADLIDNGLTDLVYGKDKPELLELEESLQKYLKLEDEIFSSPLLEKLSAPIGQLGTLLPTGAEATKRHLANEVLLRASKTLDMGRVFLKGSRFDPDVR